jgi:hypothetical protein
MIDSWGRGPVSDSFFEGLIKHGGEVKFFEKIRLNTDIFTRGHRRDHRKIIIIDDEISYIGSMNITGYNLNWRELALEDQRRIKCVFRKVFLQNYETINPYLIPNKLAFTRTVKMGDWEIVRDVPSIPLAADEKEICSADPEGPNFGNHRNALFPARIFIEKSPDGCRETRSRRLRDHAETFGCQDD